MHEPATAVLRHALPEPTTVDPGSFAFEDLNVGCADDLPVNIGEHPVQQGIGVLKGLR